MAGKLPKYDFVISEMLPNKGGFKERARGAVWEKDADANPKAPELNGKFVIGDKQYSLSLFDVSRRTRADTPVAAKTEGGL